MSNQTNSNRFRLCGIVVALLFVLGAAPAAAQKLPPIPAMACPLIEAAQAPKIDGALDEAVWSQADVQSQFYRHHGGLTRPQEFRLLTDGEWLYVGMIAGETAILDKDTETVEIFIAPQKVSDQFVAFNVTLSSKGIVKHSPDDQANWKSAFKQHADKWVLEVAIRVRPVFVDPLVRAKVFDLNLSRTRLQTVGENMEVYQQWSDTGMSSGSRYRFGEVVVGSPADRLPSIRETLKQELETARGVQGSMSAESKVAFSKMDKQAEALLAAEPGPAPLTSAAVREYQRQSDELKRSLQQVALAERGFIVWTCNPMSTPMPNDLPPSDQKDVTRLDVRVLGGEWESAAIVVNNLTSETLDGRLSLSDFASADGNTKVPGWDVLQVRTAPQISLETGVKRDPLPLLQEGALFRVPADRNELLWLTFKSRGLTPGRYKSTLTVRSLDERLLREIELVLRVYPLDLGAEGQPMVHVWDNMVRGKDWTERAANCRDYYINGFQLVNRIHLPFFTSDAEGNTGDSRLDFRGWDNDFDDFMKSGVNTYLVTMSSHGNPPASYFWPAKREDGSIAFNYKRWSPKFSEIFAKWVIGFRDNMARKGLPPERWAFYIMDEPRPGEDRQEVINFAKEVRKIDPRLRTYVTFPITAGTDTENIELSKYLDTVQVIGAAKPEVLKRVRANVKHFWTYRILNRSSSPFYSYRKDACWQSLKDGYSGTGFWVWDDTIPGYEFTWQIESNAMFPAIYSDTDGTIIPSLRTEAFREGIEDWKYVIMLDEAIAAAKKKGVDKSVISSAEAYRAKCLDELTDADSAYKFRDSARSQLLTLHEALGDVDTTVVKTVETD